MARAAALALILALAIGGTAISGAAAAGGAISLSGVTVSVLEASGSVADKHSVTGPDARLRLSLDHTRTLKVGSCAAAAAAGQDARERCCRPAEPVHRHIGCIMLNTWNCCCRWS